jgi:hypothetical protein
MSDPLKTTPPPRAPFDSQFEKEESRVRSRDHQDSRRPVAGSIRAGGGEAARESITERTARIDGKLAIAALLLERMPPTEGRARLLTSAMLRRDEVLLDAVLAEMASDVAGLASSRRGPGSGW